MSIRATEMQRAALLVIDVQQGFEDPSWGARDNPACEENIRALIAAWRQRRWPVVYVRHDSLNPASPLHPAARGNAFKKLVDGEPDLLVSKHVNSAFYGTPDLGEWLAREAIPGVVICGITTNHCCETTARMAGNLGYHTTFVIDATHTFAREDIDGHWISAEQLARVTAANLNEEFAVVSRTEALLTERGGR